MGNIFSCKKTLLGRKSTDQTMVISGYMEEVVAAWQVAKPTA